MSEQGDKLDFPEFQVYKLNEKGFEYVNRIKDEFNRLLGVIVSLCPASRELSIARTKLEEACFFTKKCVANNPDNQLKE